MGSLLPVPSVASAKARIRFGIILLPNFTLTAFSGFIDMLRLTADEGDHSKPVRCAWSVIGETLAPIRASCGVDVTPWETLGDPGRFDYIVVVGGLLHAGRQGGEATQAFLREAGSRDLSLVGICTGSFALMRAGVLKGHRLCTSWFHYWDFLDEFPSTPPELLLADRLFVIDGRRITCSGGRASIDVAAAILVLHIEPAIVQKALRILLVGESHKGNAPQPHPPGEELTKQHPKIRRAILLMEQHLGGSMSVVELAGKLDMSPRQLERLFKASTGVSPQTYARGIRMRVASWLLTHSVKSISEVASACGFSDASHLGREFRKHVGVSPTEFRARDAAGAVCAPNPSEVDYAECYPGRSEFFY